MKVVVAAAGNAKRFTKGHKLLQEFSPGQSVIQTLANTLIKAGLSDITFIVKERGNEIERHLGSRYKFVSQNQYSGLHGTAIALRSFLDTNQLDKRMIMLLGDLPLLTPEDVVNFVDQSWKTLFSFMTVQTERDEFMWIHHLNGIPWKVNREKTGIGDVGVYAFDTEWVNRKVHWLPPSHNGEYYVSGLVEVAFDDQTPATEFRLKDWTHGLGVNTVEDLLNARSLVH